MKSIEITTTQNVTIEYELAGLRDRILSQLIDLMIIFAIGLALYLVLLIAFHEEFFPDNGTGNTKSWIILSLLPMLTFTAYHFLSELFMDGQTVGKKAVGIKVIKLSGTEPTASDFMLRALFHIIDSFLSSFVLGSMLISSTDKGQRLGDLAANTAVIKVKFNMRFRLEDILKINSIEDYEPKFPDVRQFSEKDMLLIKTIVARNRIYNNPSHNEVVQKLVKDLMLKLDIREYPEKPILFLKTLIKDYIVLTR